MAKLTGHAVTRAGRAGGGVGETAGGKHYVAAGYAFAPLEDYGCGLVLIGLYAFDGCVFADSDIGIGFQFVDEGEKDVEGFAGGRIDAVATFDDEFHAALFEPLHQFAVEEAAVGVP